MKEVKVKGCSDCPCINYNPEYEEYTCNLMGDEKDDNLVENVKNETTPSWCPLLTEPITIKLDKDENKDRITSL